MRSCVVSERGLFLVVLLFPFVVYAGPQQKPDRPSIRLSRVGELQLKNLFVRDGAVLNETSLVVAGSTAIDDEKPKALDDYGPNGAIVDLVKRSSRPFTNGHQGYI